MEGSEARPPSASCGGGQPSSALDLLREIKMSAISLSPSDCLLLALDLIESSRAASRANDSSRAPPPTTVVPPSLVPPPSSTPTTANDATATTKKGGILGLKHRASSGARIAPHFDDEQVSKAEKELPLEDEKDDDDGDDEEDDGKDDHVWVPRLSSMMLNEGGNFAYAGVPRAKSTRGINLHASSSRVDEDKVMDTKNRRMTYKDVSSREKREVFQLTAVHRSMRHLNYGNVLMSEEALILGKRYMEIGPSRASLLHIGFDSLQEVCNEKTFLDELSCISPSLRMIANLKGYHWLGFVVMVSTMLCELAYYILHIQRSGSVNLTSGFSLMVCLASLVLNGNLSFSAAFKFHPLTADTPLDEIRLTGLSYVRLHGLDILAAAQRRLAHATGKSLAPSADLSLFRKRLVSSTLFECLTLHFLIGAVPLVWSSATTAARSYERGDILVSVLAAASVWSRLLMIAGLSYSSFVIRLSQKLSEFEVRRVEADIRTIQPNLTHRITPRYEEDDPRAATGYCQPRPQHDIVL